MEGTRIQAKFSVAAIAALAGASNQSVFSDLYNVYIHNLFFSLLLFGQPPVMPIIFFVV